MENERFFGNPTSLNWESSDAHRPPELNSGPPSDHLSPPCFLNLNWDQSIDHNAQFESALSSLVSSPTSNPAAAPAAAESVVIRELIGRLGNICNSGEISPPNRYHSTTTSCYSTPLNSPPKLNLSMMDPRQLQPGRGGGLPIPGSPMPSSHLSPFSADPGFAERAARFSCFGGGRNYGGGGLPAQFGLPEAGNLSRVSSSQSLRAAGGSQMVPSENGSEIPLPDGIHLEMDVRSRSDEGEFINAREESSASDRVPTGDEASLRTSVCESNGRKRKAAPKGKGKEAPLSSSAKVAEEEDINPKRCRSLETNGAEKDGAIKLKAEQNGGDSDKKQGKETNAKFPEPPKDYIHVRARRGQATDSHSLAERVRREKISERMKFLQDLVPGCNKVTGKAVMLDEIINYVQSLQRQVEFLSMKLATVNPRLDFNAENIIPKEMNQVHVHIPPHSICPIDATSTAFSYAHQPLGTPLQSVVTNGLETHYSMNHHLDSGLRQSLSMQLAHVEGFGDAASQLGAFWEDDLQSVVHMGFGQNQDAAFSSQSFHGLQSTAHMKIEL